MRINCILECDSPSYPPETEEYFECGCKSCKLEFLKRTSLDIRTYDYIKKLELEERIDPRCKSCKTHFYPQLMIGKHLTDIYAPRHKASIYCESGKHNHCTCDTCF